MNAELTIIITSYNSEKYIEKCLNSLLNQIYKDYNLIIIDDNSTDKTFDIIKNFNNKFKNIKLIKNNKNKGAGYSRNTALQFCKTKYVTFLDSDDFLEKDYYENHMNKIHELKADISICDFKIIEEYIIKISKCYTKKIDKDDFIQNGLAASPCNKVFKTKLFDNNKFAEGIMNEDIPPIITALINSKNICYIENTYYNYVQHNDSVQNSTLSNKRLDIFKSVKLLFERISEKDLEKYKEGIIYYQIILLLFYIVPRENNNKVRYKFLKKYTKMISEYNVKNNELLREYINNHNGKKKLYYKLLIFLLINKCVLLENWLISFYIKYKQKNTINVLNKKNITLDNIIILAKNQKNKQQKDISVIIPNYNYSQFLYQRIYSILNQEIAIKELIILDDCSTDDSKKIIDLVYNKLEKYISIKKIYNNSNSGCVFKQWEKGINNSSGKYIWICEADDYCNEDFLKNIFDKITEKVEIAYTNTSFIDIEGNIIQKNILNEIDINNTKHWNNDYINNGKDELQNYSYLNCTIANVSSVIFKKINFEKIIKKCTKYKQAGDWVFYNELMKKGDVLFIKKVHNYYRIHGDNVTSMNSKLLQFNEIKIIHDNLIKELNLKDDKIKKIEQREEYLKKVWKIK